MDHYHAGHGTGSSGKWLSFGLCVSVEDVGISLVEHLQLLSASEHQGMVMDRESLACCSHGVAKIQTRLN